jgi:hypothetical protein
VSRDPSIARSAQDDKRAKKRRPESSGPLDSARAAVPTYSYLSYLRAEVQGPTPISPEPEAALRSFRPPRQILFLLRRQAVDLDAHRLELQLGDALVEFVGNLVDRLIQLLVVLHHVLDG